MEDTSSATPRRILIVDDNIDAAESLATLLRLYGHEVVTAHAGETGLALARRFRPQVALVDLQMPGMDGYELATRLRESNGVTLTLIAVTGWAQGDDSGRGADAVFNHHISKPIDFVALSNLLRKV